MIKSILKSSFSGLDKGYTLDLYFTACNMPLARNFMNHYLFGHGKNFDITHLYEQYLSNYYNKYGIYTSNRNNKEIVSDFFKNTYENDQTNYYAQWGEGIWNGKDNLTKVTSDLKTFWEAAKNGQPYYLKIARQTGLRDFTHINGSDIPDMIASLNDYGMLFQGNVVEITPNAHDSRFIDLTFTDAQVKIYDRYYFKSYGGALQKEQINEALLYLDSFLTLTGIKPDDVYRKLFGDQFSDRQKLYEYLIKNFTITNPEFISISVNGYGNEYDVGGVYNLGQKIVLTLPRGLFLNDDERNIEEQATKVAPMQKDDSSEYPRANLQFYLKDHGHISWSLSDGTGTDQYRQFYTYGNVPRNKLVKSVEDDNANIDTFVSEIEHELIKQKGGQTVELTNIEINGSRWIKLFGVIFQPGETKTITIPSQPQNLAPSEGNAAQTKNETAPPQNQGASSQKTSAAAGGGTAGSIIDGILEFFVNIWNRIIQIFLPQTQPEQNTPTPPATQTAPATTATRTNTPQSTATKEAPATQTPSATSQRLPSQPPIEQLLQQTKTAVLNNKQTTSFVESGGFTTKDFEAVRQGTFMIEVIWTRNINGHEEIRDIGTATAWLERLDNNSFYIATNDHVAKSPEGDGWLIKSVALFRPNIDNNVQYFYDVIGIGNTFQDVAVLKINGTYKTQIPLKPLSFLDNTVPNPDDNLLVVGFPADFQEGSHNLNTITMGSVIKHDIPSENKDGNGVWISSGLVNGGSSGSPVVIKKGGNITVIGMIFARSYTDYKNNITNTVQKINASYITPLQIAELINSINKTPEKVTIKSQTPLISVMMQNGEKQFFGEPIDIENQLFSGYLGSPGEIIEITNNSTTDIFVLGTKIGPSQTINISSPYNASDLIKNFPNQNGVIDINKSVYLNPRSDYSGLTFRLKQGGALYGNGATLIPKTGNYAIIAEDQTSPVVSDIYLGDFESKEEISRGILFKNVTEGKIDKVNAYSGNVTGTVMELINNIGTVVSNSSYRAVPNSVSLVIDGGANNVVHDSRFDGPRDINSGAKGISLINTNHNILFKNRFAALTNAIIAQNSSNNYIVRNEFRSDTGIIAENSSLTLIHNTLDEFPPTSGPTAPIGPADLLGEEGNPGDKTLIVAINSQIEINDDYKEEVQRWVYPYLINKYLILLENGSTFSKVPSDTKVDVSAFPTLPRNTLKGNPIFQDSSPKSNLKTNFISSLFNRLNPTPVSPAFGSPISWLLNLLAPLLKPLEELFVVTSEVTIFNQEGSLFMLVKNPTYTPYFLGFIGREKFNEASLENFNRIEDFNPKGGTKLKVTNQSTITLWIFGNKVEPGKTTVIKVPEKILTTAVAIDQKDKPKVQFPPGENLVYNITSISDKDDLTEKYQNIIDPAVLLTKDITIINYTSETVPIGQLRRGTLYVSSKTGIHNVPRNESTVFVNPGETIRIPKQTADPNFDKIQIDVLGETPEFYNNVYDIDISRFKPGQRITVLNDKTERIIFLGREIPPGQQRSLTVPQLPLPNNPSVPQISLSLRPKAVTGSEKLETYLLVQGENFEISGPLSNLSALEDLLRFYFTGYELDFFNDTDTAYVNIIKSVTPDFGPITLFGISINVGDHQKINILETPQKANIPSNSQTNNINPIQNLINTRNRKPNNLASLNSVLNQLLDYQKKLALSINGDKSSESIALSKEIRETKRMINITEKRQSRYNAVFFGPGAAWLTAPVSAILGPVLAAYGATVGTTSLIRGTFALLENIVVARAPDSAFTKFIHNLHQAAININEFTLIPLRAFLNFSQRQAGQEQIRVVTEGTQKFLDALKNFRLPSLSYSLNWMDKNIGKPLFNLIIPQQLQLAVQTSGVKIAPPLQIDSKARTAAQVPLLKRTTSTNSDVNASTEIVGKSELRIDYMPENLFRLFRDDKGNVTAIEPLDTNDDFNVFLLNQGQSILITKKILLSFNSFIAIRKNDGSYEKIKLKVGQFNGSPVVELYDFITRKVISGRLESQVPAQPKLVRILPARDTEPPLPSQHRDVYVYRASGGDELIIDFNDDREFIDFLNRGVNEIEELRRKSNYDLSRLEAAMDWLRENVKGSDYLRDKAYVELGRKAPLGKVIINNSVCRERAFFEHILLAYLGIDSKVWVSPIIIFGKTERHAVVSVSKRDLVLDSTEAVYSVPISSAQYLQNVPGGRSSIKEYSVFDVVEKPVFQTAPVNTILKSENKSLIKIFVPPATLGQSTILIGRGDDVDIQIKHDHISRHHVEITVKGESISIRDNGSQNGTKLNNDELLKQEPLNPSDVITIANVAKLQFIGLKNDVIEFRYLDIGDEFGASVFVNGELFQSAVPLAIFPGFPLATWAFRSLTGYLDKTYSQKFDEWAETHLPLVKGGILATHRFAVSLDQSVWFGGLADKRDEFVASLRPRIGNLPNFFLSAWQRIKFFNKILSRQMGTFGLADPASRAFSITSEMLQNIPELPQIVELIEKNLKNNPDGFKTDLSTLFPSSFDLTTKDLIEKTLSSIFFGYEFIANPNGILVVHKIEGPVILPQLSEVGLIILPSDSQAADNLRNFGLADEQIKNAIALRDDMVYRMRTAKLTPQERSQLRIRKEVLNLRQDQDPTPSQILEIIGRGIKRESELDKKLPGGIDNLVKKAGDLAKIVSDFIYDKSSLLIEFEIGRPLAIGYASRLAHYGKEYAEVPGFKTHEEGVDWISSDQIDMSDELRIEAATVVKAHEEGHKTQGEGYQNLLSKGDLSINEIMAHGLRVILPYELLGKTVPIESAYDEGAKEYLQLGKDLASRMEQLGEKPDIAWIAWSRSALYGEYRPGIKHLQ
ncbi:FHA domain-containing protein [Candidatus Gottesmanbacteria bacterium]|nr:FHA domain-containing protein [Candidatus Gottesmanbacteria bacterium]